MPPAVVVAKTSVVRTGSAERFFQWSLYLLLVTGFMALMGTNSLDAPSLIVVIPALLLRGYLMLMRKSFTISERWTTYITIVYFAFYALDYFYISQSFIGATVHMVLFSMVIKVFSVRRDRDLVYLAVLSFLMLLAAAVLTIDSLFLLNFSLFILVAIATFVSMEMRRSEREALAAGIPRHQEAMFQRSLAGVAGLLGVLTLAGAALIFIILPRINRGQFMQSFGSRSSISTGFSQEVQLGGIGQIQQSNAVVMHIKLLYGKLPPDPRWRGLSLANFDGQVWRNPPQQRSPHGLVNSPLDLSRSNHGTAGPQSIRAQHISTLGYKVMMEPLGLDVFFLAPVALRMSGQYRMVEVAQDGSVFSSHNSFSALGDEEASANIGTYTADADTRDPRPFVRNSTSMDYPPGLALMYLQLPNGRVDHRITELARDITANSGSNYQRAQAVENYLKTKFGYTLELPGNRVPDPLAYFLFERKKGHCEYFASSMTVMLRTLGIPARVVNGFRGGEFNDLTGNYIIRQKDAHSWVEAYFPEYGWVSFDPTPGGGAAATNDTWSRVALYLDAASEVWREWVINYDFSHQMKLSAQLNTSTGKAQTSFRGWLWRLYRKMVAITLGWQERLQKLSPRQMALACILLGIVLFLPFTPKAWRAWQGARMARNPQRAPRSVASFWYLRLLKKLSRRGFHKEPTQTPVEFAASIDDPAVRKEVVTFTEHYERARFDESVNDAEKLPELFEEITGKK
jgi:protein-glutamine gamma-glutamyltransferase